MIEPKIAQAGPRRVFCCPSPGILVHTRPREASCSVLGQLVWPRQMGGTDMDEG